MEERKDKRSIFAEWLEQLQQESWQLELLISGLALFGIWEGSSVIDRFDIYVDENVYSGVMGNVAPALLKVLNVGWKIFFVNLLIHVALRGLWIGSIGLRYISGDIDYEQLNYSEYFTDYLKKKIGSYDDFIERLEWSCSVLFAYTFLLFLLFLSMMMFFTVIPLTIELFQIITGIEDINEGLVGMFGMFYVFIGLVVFIDFITLGSFKKIKDKTVSKVYSYVYRFYSAITLSFLYRPLLYNFLDNKNTRRLFYLSIPYILILSIGHNMFSSNVRPHFDTSWRMVEHGQMIKTCNYTDLKNQSLVNLDDDKKAEKLNCIPDAILSQYYMDHAYPSLFLRMKKSDQNLLSKKSGIKPIFYEGMRFSLFSSDRKDDSQLDSMLATFDGELTETRSEIRELRSEIRKNKDEAKEEELNIRMSTLKNLRDQRVSEKEQIRTDFIKNKRDKILNGLKNYHNIEIDGVPYNDSLHCNFYIHPDKGVKGILCHFKSESLDEGHHVMLIERKEWREQEADSTILLTYRLPFIKM